jgi:hypothetical protein
MKQLSKPTIFTGICATAGVLAFFLQLWFFRSVDEKGLLDTAHPGGVVSCVITVAVLFFLVFSLWRYPCKCLFPAVPVTAANTLCSAAGIAAAVWRLLSGTASILAILTGIFGAFAVLCCVVIALLRIRGHRAHPLLYCAGIVFFMLLSICMYQQWSGEPELARYCYQLLALVFLMLSAYQRAALKTGIGNGSVYLFFSRGALFFCLTAIPGSRMWLLYAAMAASVILDGCTLSTNPPQGE